jgi:hypothetical protein
MVRALAFIIGLLIAGPAFAQNVTCATRPNSDNSNACASTAFVHNYVTTVLQPIYNITDYGCVASTEGSSIDQAPCIQSAIDAANISGGGVVWIPAGYWNLKSQVQIKQNVSILCANNGAGTQFDSSVLTYGIGSGSILVIQWGSGLDAHNDPTKAAIQLQAGAGITSCGFWYPDQIWSLSAPIEFGATILTYGTSVANSNVGQFARGNWCANCYDFLDFRGSVKGLGIVGAAVENNVGSPIAFGIIINYIVDSSIFQGNHFNSGFLNPNDPSPATHLVGWVRNNGIGVLIQHSDWPHINDHQQFGYKYGIQLDFATDCCAPFIDSGPVTISRAGLDGNEIPIDINQGMTQSLRVEDSTLTAFNPGSGSARVAILLESGASIQNLQVFNNFLFGGTDGLLELNPSGGGTVGNVIASGNISTSTSGSGTCIFIASGVNVTVTSNICLGFGTPYTLSATNLIDANNQ